MASDENYNVFCIEIDWGGYRSSTPWLGVTFTMSRYDAVLAVYIIRNKKRWKRFNWGLYNLESFQKNCRTCCVRGHMKLRLFDHGRQIDDSQQRTRTIAGVPKCQQLGHARTS